MGVHCPVEFKILTQEEFRRRDYAVMKHVFACHNTLGRLCDEAIYEADLAARLSETGASVLTRVPATVTWRQFYKTYFLDLVVDNALLYELKTTTQIVGEHKTQLLNYVLLLGLQTGKLLNFRTPKVEWWFGSNQQSRESRKKVRIASSRWRDMTPACPGFREALIDMLFEFGALLDIALYREMLVWHLGGEEQVAQRIPLSRNGLVLGTQRCHLLSPEVAFSLTAHSENLAQAEDSLRRFLDHTTLRALQWINLDRVEVTFVTLEKSP